MHSPVQTETLNWRSYPKDPGLSQVLAASLVVFHEYGYHGTTVRMIATQAGMSVPGLYYHFTSKQEILVALLKQSNEDLMARAQAALAEAGDSPRERFSALVENIILYMTHRRQRMHHVAHRRGLDDQDAHNAAVFRTAPWFPQPTRD